MLFGQPVSVIWRSEQWKRKKYLPSSGHSPWGSLSMRQSFHHPALTTCGAPLPPGKKYVAIRYLTKELIYFVIDVKGKGQDIFEDACKYLGLQDTELFGLAFLQEDGYIFIDPNLKVSKYAVKSWKVAECGLGGDGQPLLVLYLRVKHYVDCHLLISEKVARHHYYLQLRDNVRSYSQPISEEKFFVLAALALQADLGNFCVQRHKGRYFEIGHYFPSWIVLKIGEDFIIRNVPALHKDNASLSRGEAQVGYIKEASDVTSPHNLHFYKMQRRKGKSWSPVWLAVSDGGLHIYEQQESEKTKSLLSTFLWCDIAKLHFEKKKFEILSEGSPDYRRFTYYVGNEALAKNLLWLCRSTHHFHMSNEARVQDLKKLHLDGDSGYRESYIYTDEVDLVQQEMQNKSLRKNSRFQNADVNGGINSRHENVANQRHNKSRNIHRLNSDACTYVAPSMINHSMESLPVGNGYPLSPDLKYKSQSIGCFSDRFLTPAMMQEHLWNPASSNNLTAMPTRTLFSQSSCASCTDSACSSLSLASGSAIKASTLNISSKKHFNDSHHWVKCDSFEELSMDRNPIETKSLPHRVCISTFKDSHVRTASVYHAVSAKDNTLSSSQPGLCNLSVTSRTSSTKMINPSQKQIVRPSCPPVTLNKYTTAKNTSGSHSRHHTNRRQNEPPVCRTATRIGVSSLSREQRLPLTLFNGRGKICGSEPNLYNPLFSCDGSKLTDFMMLRDSVQNKGNYSKKPNSRSEMCLNSIGQKVSPVDVIPFEVSSKVENGPSLGNNEESAEFPFILPPLAYRNVTQDCNAAEPQIVENNNSESSQSPQSSHRELCNSVSSPPDVLDIQQLRQKSQDLDLPLISGLCNDRSLLMLPKTVPCSRQRHLGNKDPLRFARGYSTTPTSGHMSDLVGPISRPATWHVETSSSTPWYGTPQGGMWYHRPAVTDNLTNTANVQNLPPTILTSFGKTPEKCNPTNSSPYRSTDYRSNKLQMIPTKLISGIVSNGKLHLKGSSS